MAEGVVHWFNPDKGYGFITPKNGDDLFVHFTEIQKEGFKFLEEGQHVLFEVAKTANGKPMAANVRVVDSATASSTSRRTSSPPHATSAPPPYIPPGPPVATVIPAIESPTRRDFDPSAAGLGRVFIVHGHDTTMKSEVARCLTLLGVEAIILHEQPSLGATLIEKFELNAEQADFAVVLLSPDDAGFAIADGPAAARPRARQNVVLELGYFMRALGRRNVLALVPEGGDVEQPSDILGTVYVAFDNAGAWRMHLARELKAAGLKIDANRLLGSC